MESPHRRLARIAAVVAVATFPLAAFAADAASQKAASLFSDLCSSCHTIGGGDLAGPDLAPAAKLPIAELRAAVERMEANARDLTPEEENALVDLLRREDARAIVANAPYQQPAAAASAVATGSPDIGRNLFYGEQALENGGTPCFACHAVRGQGGSLARDLTEVHLRMPETVVLSATQQPPFPLMKASYANQPVTPVEAAHIAAFLKQSSATPLVGSESRIVPQAASAVAAVFLGALALLFRWRQDGVRARLLRDSRRES